MQSSSAVMVAAKPRILVMPTGHGWAFLVALVLILLTGASYDNNLVYFLAFFLFSMVMVSGVYAHRNLRGVEVQLKSAPDVFSGHDVHLEFLLQAAGQSHESMELISSEDRWHKKIAHVSGLDADQVYKTVLVLKGAKRGRYKIPEIHLRTRFPLGLFIAWRVYEIQEDFYVYPKPEGQSELNTTDIAGQLQPRQQKVLEATDYDEHRAYQRGDSWKRIDWKVYARRGDLVVKTSAEPPSSVAWSLRYDLTPGKGMEVKLSQLALWISEANERGLEYELILPSQSYSFGTGERHYQICMRALAQFDGGAK